MDIFNVPKKVNRHVLKAVYALSGGDYQIKLKPGSIASQVKHQMRNLNPVAHFRAAVRRSLNNLSEIGLIERHRHGTFSYSLGQRIGKHKPIKKFSETQNNRNVWQKLEMNPQIIKAVSETDSDSSVKTSKELYKLTDWGIAAMKLQQNAEAAEEQQKKLAKASTVRNCWEDAIQNAKKAATKVTSLQINDSGPSTSRLNLPTTQMRPTCLSGTSLSSTTAINTNRRFIYDGYTNIGRNTGIVFKDNTNVGIPIRTEAPVNRDTDVDTASKKEEEPTDDNTATECSAQNYEVGSGQAKFKNFFFGQPK